MILINNNSPILSGLLGVAVGDALGVPVEFFTRNELQLNPVKTMRCYGSHNQPAGTWSDDSSLTFCLAQALSEKLLSESLFQTLADYFCQWYQFNFWTPHNRVFDIGYATGKAIRNLINKVSPLEAGGHGERDNGNGSLMRILPLAFCYQLTDFNELIAITHDVSSVTHGHIISQMSCGIYISIAISLLEGNNPLKAYHQGIEKISKIYQADPFISYLNKFDRIMSGNIDQLSIDSIKSSGYVINTLEASLWCFLKHNNYEKTVLSAVNLGEDTDTVGALTGGLAGIYYGQENIPQEWIKQIARLDDIINLAQRLELKIKEALSIDT